MLKFLTMTCSREKREEEKEGRMSQGNIHTCTYIHTHAYIHT